MHYKELIIALDKGLDVRWSNDSYKCFKEETGSYSVICTSNNSLIGIFSRDMQNVNIGLEDCYVKSNNDSLDVGCGFPIGESINAI